ncbi:MAG: PKD domain-containing protein, partial [Deltaproteobacteria bacterium]
AGPDVSANLGNAVTFSGSGSDPDGRVTSYGWDFGDGATAAGATASHVYVTAGTYAAKLTVTDDRGARSSDSALVTVTGAAGGTPWARSFGSEASDVGYGVAVDAGGNAVMTGRVESTVDFGGGVVCPPAAIFVSKYSPTGATLWSKCLGSAYGGGTGRAVAVDGSGNVLVTGKFGGTIDFGTGPLNSNLGGSVRRRRERRRERRCRRQRRQRRADRDRGRHGELRRRAHHGQRLRHRGGEVLAGWRAPVVERHRRFVLQLRQFGGGGPERQHRGDRRVLGPGRLRRRRAEQRRRRRLPRQAFAQRRPSLVPALRQRARHARRQRRRLRRRRQRADDRVVRELDRSRRRVDDQLRAQGRVRREVLAGGRVSLVEARGRSLRRRRQGDCGGPERQGGGDGDVPGGGQLRHRVADQRGPDGRLRGAVFS